MKFRITSLFASLLLIASVACAGFINIGGNGRYVANDTLGELYSGFEPTLYSAPTDQGAGDCSSEANACDLVQALATADEGDNVGLLPGTYTGTPTGAAAPMFAFTNSGSSGQPIRVLAKYPAVYYHSTEAYRSTICSDDPDTSNWYANSPVIGVQNNRDYIEIYGLYVDASCAPPRPDGGIIMVNDCDNCLVAEIYSAQIVTPSDDNYPTVWIQHANNSVVRDSYITGGYGSGNHNASAITTYGALDFTIENVTFDAVNNGIFIKGSSGSNTRGNRGTIRYNRSTGNSYGFIAIAVVEASSETPGNRITVTQNLSIGDGALTGAAVHFRNDGEGVRNVDFTNNTIVGGATGGGIFENEPTAVDMVLRDNVIVFTASTSVHPVNLEQAGVAGFSVLDYNLYNEAGGTMVFALEGATQSGLSNWQTATGEEANSTDEAPDFDNAGVGNYYRNNSGDTGSSTGGIRGITASPIGAPSL